MGLCPIPQQGTLFPAPFLRFAAVLTNIYKPNSIQSKPRGLSSAGLIVI